MSEPLAKDYTSAIEDMLEKVNADHISDDNIKAFEYEIEKYQYDGCRLQRLIDAANDYMEENSYSNATAFILGGLTISFPMIINIVLSLYGVTWVFALAIIVYLIVGVVIWKEINGYICKVRKRKRSAQMISIAAKELRKKTLSMQNKLDD